MKNRISQTRFSFGATSAVITNLGIITGLDALTHPKLSIIGAILVIALADNIADSLGIHVYQESECLNRREVWASTFTNFFSRLIVSLIFILLILCLPITLAVVCSIIWGFFVLTYLSYIIARKEKINPFPAILEHIAIAFVVILLSHFVGRFLINKFHAF